MGGAYPEGDGVRLHGFLDDREEALTQLLKINLLAQRRSEGLDRYFPFTKVEASLDALLDVHAHRFKDDCTGERAGDRDDKRKSGTLVEQQLHYGERTVVDDRQADREQEVDRRTREKRVDVVALGLCPGQAHQHGKQDEDRITSEEDGKQGEEGTTDEPTHNHPRDDIPLRGEASSTLSWWCRGLHAS